MTPGRSFAAKPLLATVLLLSVVACGQSNGSGNPSNSQPEGGNTSVSGGGPSTSTGGNTFAGASGGSRSTAASSTGAGAPGTNTGGTSAVGTSGGQQTLGGSSTGHKETGGSATVGGRSGSTGQGGTKSGGTAAGGAGGTATSGGAGGTSSSARQGGTAGGGASTSPKPTGGATGTGNTAQVGGSTTVGSSVRSGGSTSIGGSTSTVARTTATRSISFGTLLDAQAVMSSAQQVAKSVSNPSSSQWRAKGDQHRTYRYADANVDEPYRLYVPTNWDGQSKLPLVMFLHGSGSDENSYVDQNNKQLISLAQEHGFILVAPLGLGGTGAAYGNFLRLNSPFGDEAAAAQLMAQVTPDTERTNELSEKDVINVLELVLSEYPIDRGAVFLTGHSMGSGGTWYIGGKYSTYWTALAPMSGPFVQETGYPWDDLRNTPILITEGTQAPSLDGSHALRDWMKQNGFKMEYKEVNSDHGGMVTMVLPDVFSFFDRSKTG